MDNFNENLNVEDMQLYACLGDNNVISLGKIKKAEITVIEPDIPEYHSNAPYLFINKNETWTGSIAVKTTAETMCKVLTNGALYEDLCTLADKSDDIPFKDFTKEFDRIIDKYKLQWYEVMSILRAIKDEKE